MNASQAPWSCNGCGRRWASLVQAHCPVCHEHFGTDGLADRHRVGPMSARKCLAPPSVRRQDGREVFRATETAHGTVWRSYERREVTEADRG